MSKDTDKSTEHPLKKIAHGLTAYLFKQGDFFQIAADLRHPADEDVKRKYPTATQTQLHSLGTPKFAKGKFTMKAEIHVYDKGGNCLTGREPAKTDILMGDVESALLLMMDRFLNDLSRKDKLIEELEAINAGLHGKVEDLKAEIEDYVDRDPLPEAKPEPLPKEMDKGIPKVAPSLGATSKPYNAIAAKTRKAKAIKPTLVTTSAPPRNQGASEASQPKPSNAIAAKKKKPRRRNRRKFAKALSLLKANEVDLAKKTIKIDLKRGTVGQLREAISLFVGRRLDYHVHVIPLPKLDTKSAGLVIHTRDPDHDADRYNELKQIMMENPLLSLKTRKRFNVDFKHRKDDVTLEEVRFGIQMLKKYRYRDLFTSKPTTDQPSH